LLNATIVYRQADGSAPLAGAATSNPAITSVTIDMAERTVRFVGFTGEVSTTQAHHAQHWPQVYLDRYRRRCGRAG
jgi:hypothetical protein